ncbi:MAG: alpha-L-glutamate ligase, partial [Deltaproteobacteria bacterium]|nr:alpha-L-glutamate ligase [Deltaproteobacteria bacterium]
MPQLPTVNILFENPDWLPPLTTALSKAGFSNVNLVQLSNGLIESLSEPPQGIWINRISPSSHTRGNEYT